METQIQAGYYIWEPPGKAIQVHLHVEVVDRMLAEVMRGFGAVRKRGVEVGGLLIGTISEIPAEEKSFDTDTGMPLPVGPTPIIVKVDDFELVPCDYRRGPSYLFGDDDYQGFENAYQRWSPSLASDLYAVGYFRSHTRDGMNLGPDDLDLMDDCFPDPGHVALLIKPAGTKVSTAGFFFRENGTFPETTPLEFPFRRRELSGEEAPPHRGLSDRRRSSFENLVTATNSSGSVTSALVAQPQAPAMQHQRPEPAEIDYNLHNILPTAQGFRSGWVWMPLSFVFLLLGLMLGFQVAISLGGRSAANSASADYSLALSVSKNGDNLLVRWNPDAPLVRAADRGELEIEDRGLIKPVPLDRANLQNGSITVQRASRSVRFRLTVYPHGRVAASESVDWNQ